MIVSHARYEDEPVTESTPTYNHTIYSPFVTNDRYRDPAQTLVVDFWYMMVPIAPGRTSLGRYAGVSLNAASGSRRRVGAQESAVC